MKTTPLDQEKLRGFKYSPQTGLVYKPNGVPVTSRDIEGYLRVKINNVGIKAHRIAMVLMGEHIDGKLVDHINGKKTDNRWENLRAVSSRENGQNRHTHRAGRLVGATKRTDHRWIAQAHDKNGKQEYIGTYPTEQEAHKAYLEYINENSL